MDLGLQDRVCLVTGSSGGIGLASAKLLAAEGARTIVTGRDLERVEAARREANATFAIACDLSAPGAPAELVAEATSAVGPIECLVNNVGEAYQVGFEDVTDEQWDAMWQLNVMSYVRAIRAVLPSMKEIGAGVIVNVSSTAGKPRCSRSRGSSQTSTPGMGSAATPSHPARPQRMHGWETAGWPTSRRHEPVRRVRKSWPRSGRAVPWGGWRSPTRSGR